MLSSPFARCRQTVEPVAERHGLPVESTDAMAEGASTKDALELIRSLAGTEAMLCSHGDVIPAVISALSADGVRVQRPPLRRQGRHLRHRREARAARCRRTYVDPPGR